MPRSTKPITNFTSGKFSSKLYGRSDIDQYQNGAKELSNVIVEWFGGATRTPGTKYVAEVKYSSKATRLIPFTYSNVQSYIIEAGNLYFRYYKDNDRIESGGSPVETVTTYTESQLFDIKYAQTADLLYLVHPDVHPKQLIRSSDTSWAISDIAFEWGPWLDMNTTAITMDAGATTGTGVALVASSAFFVTGHVGAFFKMHDGYMRVTAVTNSTNAVVTILDDLTAHTATTDWYEGAWSTYRGFPSCVCFYEGRAVFAATDYQPNTIWLSEPGAFEQFAGGAEADDAITDTVNARKINRFKWVEPGTFLQLGNEGGIVRYWSGGENNALTPTNKSAKQILSEGVNGTSPVQISSISHYVQRDGKIVRTLNYALTTDNYFAGDATSLSREIVDGEIIEMSLQQAPHSIVWYVTDQGTLLSSTIDINQKVTAFTEQSDTGSYKSVATIPISGSDQTWFIVEREVDDSTVKYIEYLMPYDPVAQEDQFFIRSGITYDSTETTTITGLDHLEGETVSILADGYVQPDKVVASGAITLDRAASVVQVGLPYTSVIETLDLDAGSAIGTGITKRRHISKVFVKFHNTIGGLLGTSTKMDTITGTKPASLFTGNKEVIFSKGWAREVSVRIEQRQPLPLSVTAIYPYMTTND